MRRPLSSCRKTRPFGFESELASASRAGRTCAAAAASSRSSFVGNPYVVGGMGCALCTEECETTASMELPLTACDATLGKCDVAVGACEEVLSWCVCERVPELIVSEGWWCSGAEEWMYGCVIEGSDGARPLLTPAARTELLPATGEYAYGLEPTGRPNGGSRPSAVDIGYGSGEIAASLECRRRWRYHKATAAINARRMTPPMTPPAMAPAGDRCFELEVVMGFVEDDEESEGLDEAEEVLVVLVT
jgi:hypothetical protein